jgi:hypothetical protein
MHIVEEHSSSEDRQEMSGDGHVDGGSNFDEFSLRR